MQRLGFISTVVLALLIGNVAQAEVVIETVTVGNPGNAGELSGEGAGGVGPDHICGAVDYVYSIGKFEVTAGQYTEFLNAVAGADAYGLYRTDMWDNEHGCKIERTGSSPNYSYSVDGEWADRPVNYISWGDAARFANWLHNGQPTGVQDLTTTEDGSYYLNGTTNPYDLLAVIREPDATWTVPSEDEWYKAAYHYNDGITGNYWDYPTQSDTRPTSEAPPGTDMTKGSANYYYNSYIDPIHDRTEVGAYGEKPSCSAYGTYDQGGNVWEWNETVIDSWHGIRGGSFVDNDINLRAAWREYGTILDGSNRTGFRVAGVPELGPYPAPSPHNVVKNRYISFASNNGDTSVAFQVELTASEYFPDSVGLLAWVGEPEPGIVLPLLSRVVEEPYYSDAWPEVVHVADCEIVPAAAYEVRATDDGVAFSDPLVLSTIARPTPVFWADCVGAMEEGAWTGPNGVVNFNDITAALQCFTFEPTAPSITWMDVQPEVPDGYVGFADIHRIVQAFQGHPYPFSDPADCETAGARLSSWGNSGCLPGDGGGSRDDYPWCGDDVFEFTVEPGTLHAVHRNAVYNCCPDDILVTLTVEGTTLRLDEEEILTTPCDCMCCFDVNSTVVDLAPGSYTVEYCWLDDDPPFEKCHPAEIEVP